MEFSQNGDPDRCFRHLHVDLPSCKDRLFHHLRRRLRAGICHDVPSGKEFGGEEGRGEDAIGINNCGHTLFRCSRYGVASPKE